MMTDKDNVRQVRHINPKNFNASKMELLEEPTGVVRLLRQRQPHIYHIEKNGI